MEHLSPGRSDSPPAAAIARDGVSVIMPAYNAAGFIHEGIASILRQTHRHLELIVIDDGSTDDTARRAEIFERLDARVCVVRAERSGMSAAINNGVRRAKHEWIAILRGDDIALPNRLARQLAAARNDPSVVAWGAFAHHINDHGQRVGIAYTGPTTHDAFRRSLAAGDAVHVIHPTLFLRKTTLLAVGGYDSRFDGTEDIELQSRLAMMGDILAVPEPLVLYRVHAPAMSIQRFLRTRQLVRFIAHRQRLVSQGKAMDLAEYDAQSDSSGALQRIFIAINDIGRYCYRTSGLAFGEARAGEGLMLLLAAILLAPQHAVPRLWQQRVGRRAAHELAKPLRL